MKEKLNLAALIIGLSAIITLVGSLIINHPKAIAFVEPNSFIRNGEIIMGFFAIVILVKMIKERVIPKRKKLDNKK